jgi:hypothetical protein
MLIYMQNMHSMSLIQYAKYVNKYVNKMHDMSENMHDMYCLGHSPWDSPGPGAYACNMRIKMFNVHNMQNVLYA